MFRSRVSPYLKNGGNAGACRDHRQITNRRRTTKLYDPTREELSIREEIQAVTREADFLDGFSLSNASAATACYCDELLTWSQRCYSAYQIAADSVEGAIARSSHSRRGAAGSG